MKYHFLLKFENMALNQLHFQFQSKFALYHLIYQEYMYYNLNQYLHPIHLNIIYYISQLMNQMMMQMNIDFEHIQIDSSCN